MKKDVSLNSKSQTKTEIANNCQEDNLDEDFSLVSEPEVKRQRKWFWSTHNYYSYLGQLKLESIS